MAEPSTPMVVLLRVRHTAFDECQSDLVAIERARLTEDQLQACAAFLVPDADDEDGPHRDATLKLYDLYRQVCEAIRLQGTGVRRLRNLNDIVTLNVAYCLHLE